MPQQKTFDRYALASFLALEISCASGVDDVPSGHVAMADGEDQPTGFSFEMEDGRVLAVQVTELRGPRRFARKDSST